MNCLGDSLELVEKLEALGQAEFANFLLTFIDELAKRTTNIVVFSTALLQSKTLAWEQVQSLQDKIPYAQNVEIYGIVMTKNHSKQLIDALRDSGNSQIVDLIGQKMAAMPATNQGVENAKASDVNNNEPTSGQNMGSSPTNGPYYNNIHNSSIVNGDHNFVYGPGTASPEEVETISKAMKNMSMNMTLQNLQLGRPKKSAENVEAIFETNSVDPPDPESSFVDGCKQSKSKKSASSSASATDQTDKKIEIKNARVLFINNGFNCAPAIPVIPDDKYKYMDEAKKILRKREGSQIDAQNLKTFFKSKLKYKYSKQSDVTSTVLPVKLADFQLSCLEDKKCDACILIIGTHGGPVPFSLMMNDLEYVDLYEDIVYRFDRAKFPLDKNKPIIILVSQDYEKQIFVDAPPPIPPHDHRGVLLGLSSLPYHFSYREPDEIGSLYVAAVCRIFEQKFAYMELRDMLDLVAEKVSQMCEELSTAEQKKKNGRRPKKCKIPTYSTHLLTSKLYLKAST